MISPENNPSREQLAADGSVEVWMLSEDGLDASVAHMKAVAINEYFGRDACSPGDMAFCRSEDESFFVFLRDLPESELDAMMESYRMSMFESVDRRTFLAGVAFARAFEPEEYERMHMAAYLPGASVAQSVMLEADGACLDPIQRVRRWVHASAKNDKFSALSESLGALILLGDDTDHKKAKRMLKEVAKMARGKDAKAKQVILEMVNTFRLALTLVGQLGRAA